MEGMDGKQADVGCESGEVPRTRFQAIRSSQFVKWTGLRFRLLLFNAWPLFLVETAYSAVSSIIVGPVAAIAFRSIAEHSGFTVLTPQAIGELLFRPVTLLLIVALALLVAIYSLLDISAAIFTFHCSRSKIKVTVTDIVSFSMRNALRAVLPRNLPIVFVVLVLLPLMSIGVTSSFLPSVELPSFAVDYIRSSASFAIAFVVCFAVLFFLALRWSFAMHFFTIEQEDFVASARRSAHLPRAHRIRNMVSMLIVQAALAAVNALIIFVGTRLTFVSAGCIGVATVPGAIVTTAVVFAFGAAAAVLSILGMPIGCLKISGTYYDLKEEAGEPVPSIPFTPHAKHGRASRIGRWVCGIAVGAFFILCIVYVYTTANGLLTDNPLDTEPADVIAYRGDGESGAENSLESFESALDKGASGLFADVQVSRDGVFFLASSPNLASLSNLSTSARDTDWSSIREGQIMGTSLGSVAVSRFSTLEELLALARERDAELILDVSDIDCAGGEFAAVLRIVDSYGMRDSCEFASDSYDDVEAVDAYDENLQTVYVAGIALGSFASHRAADAIALESLAIDEDYIRTIHGSGKSVYGWGLTSDNAVSEAVKSGADKVATSRVESAVGIAERHGYSDFAYLLLNGARE